MRRSGDQIEGDLARLREYLVRPRTMADLVRETHVDRRTVFRWFDLLGGVERVGVERPTRYRLRHVTPAQEAR